MTTLTVIVWTVFTFAAGTCIDPQRIVRRFARRRALPPALPFCYVCRETAGLIENFPARGLSTCGFHQHQIDNEVRAVLGEPLRRHYFYESLQEAAVTAIASLF